MSKRKRKPRDRPRRPAASPPSGIHVFRCRNGMLTCRIVECPEHVHVLIGGIHRGAMTRREDHAYEKWMMPIVLPYEDDPRPLYIDHEDGTRRAFVHKLSDGRVLAAMATKIE